MAAISLVDGMDPSALRLFLIAVEFGSVSKAAQRMNVSQPSATAKLKKLERQLGVTLLERSRVGSRPTDVGERLAPACADVLAAVERLVDRAEATRHERERLAIAVTRHVADHFLPQWMPDLDLDHVRLDLLETSTRDVARSLRSGAAVLGFTEGPDAPIGLGSVLLASERIAPVIGRVHPWWGRRSPVSVAEVVSSPLILTTAESGTRDVVQAALGAGPLITDEGHDVIEVANASAARVSVLAGVGVGFLPLCWVAALEAEGSLRTLDVAEVRIEQPVRLAWRGTQPAMGTARHVVARLVERAARGAAS